MPVAMPTPTRPRGPSTRLQHADRALNPTRAVAPAIFQTSTFRWGSPEEGEALGAQTAPAEFYSRWGNPNTRQLEALVADLEGAEGALAVASGMAAACLAIVPFLRAGDHVVAGRTLYGEVNGLLTRVLPRFGVEATVVTGTGPDDYARAMRPNTRLVVAETPANPTLDCVDIAAVAEVARAGGARLVVDNTFATPLNTRPLELGAHASFHSGTKYLGGHSDVVAGVLASDREGVELAWDHLRVFGPVLGPFDAWLVTRGLRTLALRVARQNENAARIAEFLASHPAVARVNYPGLASHPAHAVAAKQMRGFGGVVSFAPAGGVEASKRLLGRLRLFTLATSLGGTESLVMFPASLSRMSPETRLASGISPELVRLSVGCEDADDLVDDLAEALSA
jgi:cystathionine beta-lyase/cystathionine gamma-synthase